MYTQVGNRAKEWKITDLSTLTLFTANANNSRLYETKELKIGLEVFPEIDLQASPAKQVLSGRTVSLQILRVPIIATDLVRTSIDLQALDYEV